MVLSHFLHSDAWPMVPGTTETATLAKRAKIKIARVIFDIAGTKNVSQDKRQCLNGT